MHSFRFAFTWIQQLQGVSSIDVELGKLSFVSESVAPRTNGRWLNGCQSCFRFEESSRRRHEESECQQDESMDVFTWHV